ncbi:hypothetical protein O0L34_g8319 [Tuta absoluta]|nr:hypothetical protein O0L34_g8319 [Tuta absoluta]
MSRIEAKKFLRCYRRPVPQRVNDIGVWYRILDSIGKLSIITNGFIIAFTSEFIPRLVYMFEKGNMNDYVDFTIAEFNTTVLEHGPKLSTYNQTMCLYPGYWYYKPGDDYQRSDWYWHVMGARLAFVVVFENVVALVMIIVRWAIPDMSGELRDRIRREAYVINSFILEETRARSLASRARTPRDPRYPADAPPAETAGETVGSNLNHLVSMSGSDFDLAAHGVSGDIRESTTHIVADIPEDAPPPTHL